MSVRNSSTADNWLTTLATRPEYVNETLLYYQFACFTYRNMTMYGLAGLIVDESATVSNLHPF